MSQKGSLATMKQLVVLGGSGFLGSRVVTACKQLPDVEVKVASRRGQLVVDVTKPETFEALRGADLVIDLTDATSTPPDAVIAWCLAQKITVIEATSDAPCVERLYSQNQTKTSGHLVLGGGIFTGVSNLLARDVATTVGQATALTFAVATSPFSGAGAGTIALMVHALGVPTVRYRNGTRAEVAKLERGDDVTFGSTRRMTVRTSFAEPFMLHRSLGVPTVDAVLAPKPGLLATMFLLTPAFMLVSAFGQWAMSLYFTLLRRVLLRSVPTSVELVASATGSNGAASRLVTARDGMMAGAWALAAMAEEVLKLPTRTGVSFIDELTSLQPIIDRANALASSEVFQLSPATPVEALSRKNEP